LRELRPEVVNPWAMGGMSLSLLERAGAAGLPIVVVVGDDWLRYGPEVDAWTRIFSRRPWAATLGHALTRIPTRVEWSSVESWLFNSETVRRRALAARPDLRGTEVAHPGVEPDRLHPAPRPRWRWRLLCLGRIDPRKGVDTAVRALAELPGEATLAVVGGGDAQHLDELRNLASELGLEDRVSFRRVSRSELSLTYAKADALVFPVRWEEPWGLVPLEAMAVGCPVIATGTGGSSEYLRDGENCLLFERDRPDALAGAARRLARDETLRIRLRDAGFATAARFPESAYNEAVAVAIERAARAGDVPC
jgi:glycogen synthase